MEEMKKYAVLVVLLIISRHAWGIYAENIIAHSEIAPYVRDTNPASSLLGPPDALLDQSSPFGYTGCTDFEEVDAYTPGFVAVDFGGKIIPDISGDDITIHLVDWHPDEEESFETFASLDGISFYSLGIAQPFGQPQKRASVSFDLTDAGLSSAQYIMLTNGRIDIERFHEGPDIDAIEAISEPPCWWEPSIPLGTERTQPGVTVGSDGVIYAIGGEGRNPKLPLRTAEKWSEGQSAWQPIEPMSIERHCVGVVTDSFGYIWAIGGHAVGGVVLDTVEIYDPTSDTWQPGSSMNEVRCHHGVATDYNGCIYVFGGRDASEATSSVEKYNPLTGLWSYISSLNEARINPGFTTGQQGRIYAIGGSTYSQGSAQRLSSVEVYDPANPTLGWHYVANLPTPVSAATAFEFNGEIWLVGGGSGLGSGMPYWTADCYIYNPDADIWRTGPTMYEIFAHAGATVGLSGIPYVIGGERGGGSVASNHVSKLICEPADWCDQPLVNTPANEQKPVWSPDGKQIAYLSDESGSYQIYIINSDGTGKWQLTNAVGGKDAWFVTWSPDSQYLLYAYGNNHPYDLYKAKLKDTRDGISELWNLTQAPSPSLNLGWGPGHFSPDGQWIVAHRCYNGWPRLRIISNRDADAHEGDWTPIGKNYGMSVNPTWKPDSTLIAYSYYDNYHHSIHSDICTILPDGTNDTVLVDRSRTQQHTQTVAWCQSGSDLAFAEGLWSQTTKPLGLVSADGVNISWLDQGPAGLPAQHYSWQADIWSPDGNSFVYSYKENENWDIYLIDKDGNNKRLIASSPGIDVLARFSVDGRIAFQTDRDGNWDIYIAQLCNTPPIANAGPDQIVEQESYAGTEVVLDGSTSTDPDNDIVSYDWYEADTFLGSGEVTSYIFPLGTHIVTLIVTDTFGETDDDEVTITVQDTTPPTINSISANPNTLWPPNHKMVEVTVTVDSEDICDPAPVCRIVNVTSNESINGPGDGNTEPDWQITGDLTVNLRAERSGGGTGRVYTIHLECTDASGNTTTATTEVTVPHDKGKSK